MENRSNSTVGTHARQRSRPQDIYYHIRRSSPIITLLILLFLTFSPLLKHNEPVQKNSTCDILLEISTKSLERSSVAQHLSTLSMIPTYTMIKKNNNQFITLLLKKLAKKHGIKNILIKEMNLNIVYKFN